MKALRRYLKSQFEWNDLIDSSYQAQTLPWRSLKKTRMSTEYSSVKKIILLKSKMVIAFLVICLIVLVWSKAAVAGNMATAGQAQISLPSAAGCNQSAKGNSGQKGSLAPGLFFMAGFNVPPGAKTHQRFRRRKHHALRVVAIMVIVAIPVSIAVSNVAAEIEHPIR